MQKRTTLLIIKIDPIQPYNEFVKFAFVQGPTLHLFLCYYTERLSNNHGLQTHYNPFGVIHRLHVPRRTTS
jgi:hypothetical protein